MEELTKAQRRRLREVALLAHERELSGALEELETDFKGWRNGEIDAFELKERIHAFHQGPARELWGVYDAMGAAPAVARALAYKVLDESEVEAPLRELLARQIEYYEEQTR